MRIVTPIARRLAALSGVLLAAGLLFLPAPAGAQDFFGISEALQPGNSISLTLGRTRAKHTDTTTPANDSNEDAASRDLRGRLRKGPIGLGALRGTTRKHDVTTGVDQTDDSDESAGIALLSFRGPFTKDSDQLILEVSASRRHETFNYNGYERKLDFAVGSERGLIYQLGFLIVGYARGNEQVQLRVNDPSVPSFDQEFYDFRYNVRALGLEFGKADKFGLFLLGIQKDTPFVPGTVFDMEKGFQTLREAELRLWSLTLGGSQTHTRTAFTGAILRDTVETVASINLSLGKFFTVGFSHKRTESTQGKTVSAVPSLTRDDHIEDGLKVELSF